MESPSKRDASIVVRVWIEDHDPRVRGRVVSTLDDTASAGVGIDELCAAVRRLLVRIEST